MAAHVVVIPAYTPEVRGVLGRKKRSKSVLRDLMAMFREGVSSSWGGCVLHLGQTATLNRTVQRDVTTMQWPVCVCVCALFAFRVLEP